MRAATYIYHQTILKYSVDFCWWSYTMANVNAIKNKTKPLKAKDYLSTAGQLNLTKMTDDALAAFENIRCTGHGEGNQRRSRGVIIGSYRKILDGQGWALREREQALRNLRDMDDLNANAE